MIKKNLIKTCTFLLFGASAYLMSCGSSSEEPTIDCNNAGLSVSVSSTTDATCDGSGSITVAGSGGNGTYEYSIDGAGFQSAGLFPSVAAGSYTVTVRDGNGCTATVQATVGSDAAVVTVSTTDVTDSGGCGTSNGRVTVTATGGDGNYQYRIDGGSFGTASLFTGLSHGSHTVEAMDGNGCSGTLSVDVLSGISYAASVANIIATSCAVPGCHVAGTGRTDFTNFGVVQANAAGIKTRTQSGDMPRGSTLTQDEKDRIACWVDDGAMNN